MARKNDYIEEVDRFIGSKIYNLRLGRGYSRQQLATLIGVTHQQLQKYEKGTNRLSAGRLVLIAKALGTTVESCYEGLDTNSSEPIITKHQRMCIEVSRNFMKITSSDHQNAVNSLVRSLIKEVA
jgi:transcriptional regulator with XRE-family HTH domain